MAATVAEVQMTAEHILACIAEELQDQGEVQLLDALQQCEAELEYANSWDDHTEWNLVVFLPRPLFKTLRSEARSIEERLTTIANNSSRYFRKDGVNQVSILSFPPDPVGWRDAVAKPVQIIQQEEDKMWQSGLLRLFLSHKSEQKSKLALVKAELIDYGIDSFLAHQEIRATKKWRDMIQQGLQSCHAMLAVSTPGFHESLWCMQEIGWCMCRGVLVMPFLAGESPQGFHAELQGPNGALDEPEEVAARIAKALCEDPRTNPLVFKGIAERLRGATDGEKIDSVWRKLQELADCPAQLLTDIETAFELNAASKTSLEAWSGIPNWIASRRRSLGVSKPTASMPSERPKPPASVFADDEYDPFADN